MITLWTKSILALPLIGLAIFNLIVMLEFLGRTERRYDPESLRLIHRIVGIAYIVLFVVLSYFCLRIMRASGQELSARAALHGLLAVAAFVLLIFKISFVRFYKKYYAMAPTLGIAVVLLTVTTAATSAGYYLTMSGTQATVSSISVEEGFAEEGAAVYAKMCAGCHHADKTEVKIGPGLKGLFQKEKLPVSGSPVTDESIRKQLKTPIKAMPAFADMPEDQIKGLLAFLRSL